MLRTRPFVCRTDRSMNSTPHSPHALRPGTVVTVCMKGLFKLARHFALVTEKVCADGLSVVIANAIETGGPAEVSWSAFVQGRAFRAFYPSALPPETVLANAHDLFGRATASCTGIASISPMPPMAASAAATRFAAAWRWRR